MSLEQFEHMTIGDLRKLTEEYKRCQDIIAKQEETIKKLKIKYPTKNVDDEKFDINKIIEECDK
jgi:hypothetical protein